MLPATGTQRKNALPTAFKRSRTALCSKKKRWAVAKDREPGHIWAQKPPAGRTAVTTAGAGSNNVILSLVLPDRPSRLSRYTTISYTVCNFFRHNHDCSTSLLTAADYGIMLVRSLPMSTRSGTPPSVPIDSVGKLLICTGVTCRGALGECVLEK